MIVLDASVLIAYLDGRDEHHGRAEALLSREIDDDFAASCVTLAETLVAPAWSGRLDTARETLRALEIRELPLPAGASVMLAELRAHTNLKMRDCSVLLAAAEADARIASFDDRRLTVAASRGLITISR